MPAKRDQQKRKRKAPKAKSSPSVPFRVIVPQSRSVVLVYPTNVQIVEGAVGVGSAKMLRINAPYDVDPSLGSTSVPGFSEMASMFYSYRVHSVSIDVDCGISGATGPGAFGEISLFPTAQSSVPSNAQAWRCQRLGTSKTVYPGAGYAGGLVPKLRLDVNIPKFLGISNTQFLSSPWYQALCTSIPTTLVFVAIGVRSSGSSTPITGNAEVRVAMRIQFFDPVPLSN